MDERQAGEAPEMDAKTAREIQQREDAARENRETELLRAYCKERGIQLEPVIVLGARGVIKAVVQIRIVDQA